MTQHLYVKVDGGWISVSAYDVPEAITSGALMGLIDAGGGFKPVWLAAKSGESLAFRVNDGRTVMCTVLIAGSPTLAAGRMEAYPMFLIPDGELDGAAPGSVEELRAKLIAQIRRVDELDEDLKKLRGDAPLH